MSALCHFRRRPHDDRLLPAAAVLR
jgi:hypothetical protein